jgi:signal transduction histidine kinase/ligand-binding sensor domain-containing protein
LKDSNTSRDGRTKPRWWFEWLSPAVLLVCLVNLANALSPNKVISQYLRDEWGPEQGFPEGSVYAIAQTPDGYLWIGTQKGLVRFDGFTFHLFQRSDSPIVPDGPVLGLAVDAEGDLWIRGQGARLVRYRDGTSQDVGGDLERAEQDVTAMCEGENGEALFSGLANGTFRYNKGRFATLASGPPGKLVISLAETADGKVWMGTNAGLYYLGDGQAHAILGGLPDRKIDSLLPVNSHDLWIGTDDGVVRWDGTEFLPATASHALDHVQALVMTRDRDSNVWVGTSNGLIRISARGVSSSERGGHQLTGAVTALFEDREGDLWVGTARGLERLRDSVFTTYSASTGLPSESSGPIYVDSEGRTWFAPLEGGLYWLKDGQVGRVTSAGLDRDVVYSISGDNGELWLGRRDGGLTRLRYSGDSFTTKTYTQAQGLVQNSIFAVHENRDGTVWAGTLTGGLSKLKDDRFKTYTTRDGLGSNTVDSILESSDGTMWFGTPNGLSELAKGRWRSYTSRDGLPAGNVNCIFEDSKGILWIGTVNGLAFMGSGTIQIPPDEPEWLQEQIFGIEEDRYGSLWMATSSHVLRVNREKLLRGSLGERDVREYGLADGLLNASGVARHQSVIADSFGRIWFSMGRGLSFVDPRPMTPSAPALVHILGILGGGRSINPGERVRIPPPHQRVTIRFTALSLSVPSRVRFEYRLDGFDQGWSEPAASREATYTNLSPGSYRFRVIASNSDGLWNSAEAALVFEIEPLFWQTWWFRLSSLLAVALAALALYRLRMHQLTEQLHVRFEERLAERTRIARELHDTLLQSFHGLLLRFQTVSNLLPERPAEAKQRLDSAIDQASQAITEGRDAVQQLRSSTTVTNDLAVAVRTLGEELAAHETNQNFAVFHVGVEGVPRNLHPILRDEVYRIAGEALRNAFRHARARQIEVEIHYDERQLRLRVRDNGKGIDPKVLDEEGRAGHFGLHGMHERAKLVGGNLDVWSKLESGTEVELSVPASLAYAGSPTSRRSRFSEKEKQVKS